MPGVSDQVPPNGAGWWSRRSEGERIALIGLVTALLTTLLTVVGGIASGVVQLQGADRQQQEQAKDDAIAGLQEEVDALRRQLQDASATRTTQTAPRASSGDTPGPTGGSGQRRATNPSLRVSFGVEVDLDSQAPNWGVTTEADPAADLDVARTLAYTMMAKKGKLAEPAFGRGPEACTNATVFHDSIGFDVPVCLRTNQGRWALVEMTDGNGTALLTITVWN